MALPLDSKLTQKLKALEERSQSLSHELSDPELAGDMTRFKAASRAYAELQPIVKAFQDYRKVETDLSGAKELLASADGELKALATEEVRDLEARYASLQQELRVLLLPSDPNDARNVVLEVRAGTGGDEATLFARELYRMYQMFAEGKRWKIRTTDCSESAVGGFKEVVALIEGDRVYSRMKFESGVHRVQRVPKTETQGRVHTSAVTVAVLPEADEVELHIEDKDLRIDTFCSSGPGGQSVNTTQSAVRIVHLPTGVTVQCQDEKSWHKNKAQAMTVLRSRLYDRKLQEQHDEIARERKGMIGSGDRSEKIRTYNFPQNRITDHRIKVSVHNLPAFMNGEIDEVLDELQTHDQAARLQAEVQQ